MNAERTPWDLKCIPLGLTILILIHRFFKPEQSEFQSLVPVLDLHCATRNAIIISDIGLVAMVLLLSYAGPSFFFKYYLVPYLASPVRLLRYPGTDRLLPPS